MSLCGRRGVLQLIFRRPLGSDGDYRLRCCKSWRCPKCRRLLAYKYSKKVESMLGADFTQMNKSGKSVLVLWTLGTSLPYSELGLKKLSLHWDRLRKQFKVLNIYKYIAVLEVGSHGGRLHYHCLFKTYNGLPVSHSALLSVWREICGERANVNFRSLPVDLASPGGYLMKYMTKGTLDGVKFRRLRNSKGLQPEFTPVEQEYIIAGSHPSAMSPFVYLQSNLDNVSTYGGDIIPLFDRDGDVCDFVFRERAVHGH